MAPPASFPLTARFQEEAAMLAARYLVGNERRFNHTKGVVRQAAKLARRLRRYDEQMWNNAWGDRLIAAAWVHDVGYGANETDFHPLDGANVLKGTILEPLAWAVALHSGASAEGELRGVSCGVYHVEDRMFLDCLTYADLTTGPDGTRMKVCERIEDIKSRYPMEHPAYGACIRNHDDFFRIVKTIEAIPNQSIGLPDIAAFDVDGTLLDTNSKLSQTTRDILARFTSGERRILLASGKHSSSIRREADILNATGPHIACNGSIICTFDETISYDVQSSLSRESSQAILKQLSARGLMAAAFTPDIIAVSLDDDVTELHRIGEMTTIVDNLNHYLTKAEVLKILTVLPHDSDPTIEAELRSLFSGNLATQRTGRAFLEFGPPGTSKGAAFSCLHQSNDYGLVAAFGDAENDLPLLFEADWAVAVSNADPLVQDAADEVCASNDESGPALWLLGKMENL